MSDRLLVGTRKGFFALNRTAGGWKVAQTAFLGSPVNYVLHDARDGTLYAALDLGHFGAKLHKSGDGGVTWSELSAPAFAKSEEDDAPSVKLIWTLAAGRADQPGRLWAGTIPGGLFVSDDGGESWALNEPLWNRPEREKWFGGGFDQPGIHSIIVDGRNANRVVLGVSCGGVWRTDDDGANWTVHGNGMTADYVPPEFDLPEVQDPHCLVQCAAAPDHYWTQHHNGIFRSIDDLESWQRIEKLGPSTFGFAVAVHPTDPNTAWFAPAVKDEFRYPVDGKFVVTRTTDGGKTAEILEKGLPEATAYDLVYRHALAIDATGEKLAIGSTSGGFWTTDDGGDHWTMLPDRLPPVYSVTFV